MAYLAINLLKVVEKARIIGLSYPEPNSDTKFNETTDFEEIELISNYSNFLIATKK